MPDNNSNKINPDSTQDGSGSLALGVEYLYVFM